MKITTKKIALLIILILFLAAGASFFLDKKFDPSVWFNVPKEISGALSFEDKTITDNTSPFKIAITYPYISDLDDFNKKIKDIIDKEIADFKTNSLANDQAVKETDPVDYAKYPREYDLNIGYDKGKIDENVVSTVLNVYNFEGGAHGASYFIPVNYNPKSKTEIKLIDLFPNQTDYLQKISAFCMANLTKQIDPNYTDSSWMNDGAGPDEKNFSVFLINSDDTITFYFPQYQVAAYAAGSFTVTMPR